jgi:hypothetical protein
MSDPERSHGGAISLQLTPTSFFDRVLAPRRDLLQRLL